MARQGNQSRRRNTPVSAKTCDPRFLPCCLLDLHIISKSKRSIGALKHIPMCTSFLFLVGVSSSQLICQRRPTSGIPSSAAFSCRPSRFVLSAMYHVQSALSQSRLLIGITQQSIRRSHCLELVPCLLTMLMDWAISQTHSRSLLSIRCVVKPPLFCQIPMVSGAHWPTPILAFSAQIRTCTVGIWIGFASAMTGFGNQKASHLVWGSQRWPMIQWWISNSGYSKQASGDLNISSRVMRWGSRGEDSVSMVLEIVSNVGRQGRYMNGFGGFSWSSNIILAAIQLGGNLLTIISVPWFVDQMLKFITMTTKSMLCSRFSLVCPCSSFSTTQ